MALPWIAYGIGALAGYYLGHGMGVAKGLRFAYAPLADDPQLREVYMRRAGVTSPPAQFEQFVAYSQRPFRFMTITQERMKFVPKKEAETRAHLAQDALLPWYRSLPGASGGIGISCVAQTRLPDGRWRAPYYEQEMKNCYTAVSINLRTPEDVSMARAHLGDSYEGVPLLYRTMGDLYAQTQ